MSSYLYNDPNDLRGYGGGHWIGCDCDRCRQLRKEHTRRFGTGCECPICQWWKDREHYKARERAQKMAAVNVCDRCETLVKGEALGAITFETSPVSGRVEKEICPGCVEDFLEFYDNYDPATSERPRAYSKPFVPKSDEPDPAESFAERVASSLSEKLPKALNGGKDTETPQDRPRRTVTQSDESVWIDHDDG